jgi:hypothetical protein
MKIPDRAAAIGVRVLAIAFAAAPAAMPAASAQGPAAPESAAAAPAAAAPSPADSPPPPVVVPPPPPLPCTAAEAKQFDFWLGDWKVAWDATPGMPAGTGVNRVSRILDGCVIEENFRTDEAEPLVGRSLSVWNPGRRLWQQTWVDNQGSYLDFTGGLGDGRMTLAREGTGSNGKRRLQRMIFENIRSDALDWRWESSADGREWQTNWRIRYTRIR